MEPFDFNNINLVPAKCIVDSRSQCNTSAVLGKRIFKLPVVPANMECIIDMEVAENLAKHGYFYILHRFYTNAEVVAFCKRMYEKNYYISISVGVNDDSFELLQTLYNEKIIPDYVTVDIAHGHAIKMQSMLKFIHELFEVQRPFIIAGNVCTTEAVKDLEAWGADAIKVGIGPGSACTTYTATGFGSRGVQASAIAMCAKVAKRACIIADGGIKEPGDIAKALVLGASWVMVGGMFSGLQDGPGNIVSGLDGHRYKEFWGSASAFQSGKLRRIEGMKRLVQLQDRTFLEEMNYLEECLQSAISYGGGKTLVDLAFVSYIRK